MLREPHLLNKLLEASTYQEPISFESTGANGLFENGTASLCAVPLGETFDGRPWRCISFQKRRYANQNKVRLYVHTYL